ncbi:unnamed protein product [Fusarium graminearum]|uniref:Uncharacterized protein n=1 Tax=Gibberella zeae TaxID=5518 RepID=A0A4E9EMP0_GIBZA|nr:unnamed protein product [Fusarium graminearum]CAG1984701.1 unnamed protein product [Fusarium graminearum]
MVFIEITADVDFDSERPGAGVAASIGPAQQSAAQRLGPRLGWTGQGPSDYECTVDPTVVGVAHY